MASIDEDKGIYEHGIKDGLLIVCVSMCAILSEARRWYWILGTGVTNVCELPCGSWELNLDPMQKQQDLLTMEQFL